VDEYDDRERSGSEACAAFQRSLERRLADEEPAGPALDVGEHGRECPECAALGRLIEVLAEAPPLATRDLARRVLASHEASRRRWRIGLLVSSATAAVAAAAALLFVLAPGAAREAPAGGPEAPDLIAFAVERGAVRLSSGGAEARRPGNGDRIQAGRPALLTSGSGVAIGLGTGAEITLVTLDARAPVFSLGSGRAAFRVDPGAPPRLAIETAAGRVVVDGSGHRAGSAAAAGATILMVEVAGTEVRLDVASGSAVFEVGAGSASRREVVVGAGQGFGPGRSGPGPLEDERRSTLFALLGLVPEDGTAAVAGEVAGPDGNPEAEGDPAGAGPERRPGRSEPQGRRAGGDGPAGPEVEPGSSAQTPGELIALAREQRAAGNWSAAADLYRRVLAGHSSRPEATAVLVPLAELELEHLRRPDLALGHFGLYVGKLPGGPLGEEALHGKCLALRALGRMNEEAAALAEFLRRYPGSVRAPGVKTRLDNLGEKIE
jgi:hypothetical protein